MPRLLYIGAGNVWRGGAGYLVRQSLFLGALSQVADLHLAMFDCDPTNAPAHAKQLTALGPLKRTQGSRFSNLADDFLNPLPRMFRGSDLAPARQLVKDLKPESFDAIFSFRIDFGHFAGVLDHPRLILDID